MINKLTKGLSIYYQLSLALICGVIISFIVYFWNQGFIDGTRANNLHKVNYVLEEIAAEKPLKQVNKYVLNENHKLALEKFDLLEKRLESINELVSDEDFKHIQEQNQKVKSSLAGLISFSSSEKIINVFNGKLLKFNNYVSNNNWMTLKRSSKRILSLTQGYVGQKDLKSLSTRIFKNIDMMKKITEGSVLKRWEKIEIKRRLAGLEVEMKMINRYVEKRSKSLNLLKVYFQTMHGWLDKVSPQLTMGKIQSQQIGKYYLVSLFVILFLGILFLVGGKYFAKFNRKSSLEDFENFIQDYIDLNLLTDDEKIDLSDFSDSFQQFSKKRSEYVNKRMSLGAIFQEGLPFSSVLLDKNLKVAWSNKAFQELFCLEDNELTSDYLSWDYLSKLTNLGDDDPVIEALQKFLGGIYQVQVQSSSESPIKHMEMFISPVNYKDKKYLSLYFYSLDEMEEAIETQAKGIVSPVQQAIERLMESKFSAKELELEQEFKKHKLIPLFNSFKKLNQNQEALKENLYQEIEILNSKLSSFESLYSQLSKTITDIREQSGLGREALKVFKENVIESFVYISDLYDESKNAFQSYRSLLTSYSHLAKGHRDLSEQSQLGTELIQKVLRYKEEFKLIKEEIAALNSKLSFSISNFVHLKNSLNKDEKQKFSELYEKMMTCHNGFQNKWKEAQKLMMDLDIAMVKNEQFLKNLSPVDTRLSLDHSYAESLGKAFNLIEEKSSSVMREVGTKEENIVGALKQNYEANALTRKYLTDLDDVLGQKPVYQGFFANSAPASEGPQLES